MIHVVIGHLIKFLDCVPEELDCAVSNNTMIKSNPIAYSEEGEKTIVEFSKAHPFMDRDTIAKKLNFNRIRVREVRNAHNFYAGNNALMKKKIASHLPPQIPERMTWKKTKTRSKARTKARCIWPAMPEEDQPLFAAMVDELWPEHSHASDV